MQKIEKELIEKQFASFCCKVIKNALIDYRRSEERNRKHNIPAIPISMIHESDIIVRTGIDNVNEAHTFYISSIEQTVNIFDLKLAAALNELPQNYRDILLMSCILDIPDREIGANIGVSHQRVSVVRKKAIQRIKEIIMLGGRNEK